MPRRSFTCGVYVIVSEDGRKYIGSSSRVEQRFSEHRWNLNRGSHHSPYLQRIWSKRKGKGFTFDILEICAVEQLLSREQHFIDELKPIFNSAQVAGSRRGVPASEATKAKISKAFKGRKLSAKARANMRRAQKLRAENITEEERRRLSEQMKRTMARPEMRKLASQRATLRNRDPDFRAKVSAGKKGRPGWIPTEETRRKRSEALKGRVNGPLAESVKRKISKAVKRSLTVKPRLRSTDGTFLARV